MSTNTRSTRVEENPAHIVKIELSRAGMAKDGKQIVNVYEKWGNFPMFQIKERDFYMLTRAGIDINALEMEKIINVDLSVSWKIDKDADGRPKLNSKGNPYKSAVGVANNATAAESATAATLDEIHRMLRYIIDSKEGATMTSARLLEKHRRETGTTETADAMALAGLKKGAAVMVQGKSETRKMILESVNGSTFAARMEQGGDLYTLPKARFLGMA